MRKVLFFILLIINCQLSIDNVCAQPDKKAGLSLVKIVTTKADATQIGETTGFAIPSPTNEGAIEIVSPYTPFKQAAKATVIDSKGKAALAHRITGANDLYDVVRFTIDNAAGVASGSPVVAPSARAGIKEPRERSDRATIPPLPVASQKLAAGRKAYILKNLGKGKTQTIEVTIGEAPELSGLTYYTIFRPADETLTGSPLLNAKGEVVGVIQRNAASQTDKTYAIGIEFNEALTVSTMSAADPALQSIFIPKQLPAVQEQGSSYLYLLTKNTEDTLSYLANLGDFIEKFPEDFFGYTERAQYYAATQQYAYAEADLNKALEMCAEKADIHSSISNIIYGLNQSKAYKQYKDWDLNRALSEIEQAYSLNPTPLFLMQKGKCLYALKRYSEAVDTYAEINSTRFRSSENLFCQSRALEMAGGDSTEVIALLDSAVTRFMRPLRPDAAPYLLYYANTCNRYGYYKEAALGYQEYESLVGTKTLSDVFFYNKEQGELKARLYPQALNDIEKAISLKPQEYVYQIEKALIETRTGHFEEAIYTATQAQKLDPYDPDSYKLIGISLGELGRKAEARQNLQRAYELGDEQALEWLNSMK